jgi:hypothetical protein
VTDALIHQVVLAVGSGPIYRPCVEDLFAGPEQGALVADRLDHSAGVPSEDARLCLDVGPGLPALVIDVFEEQ